MIEWLSDNKLNLLVSRISENRILGFWKFDNYFGIYDYRQKQVTNTNNGLVLNCIQRGQNWKKRQ